MSNNKFYIFRKSNRDDDDDIEIYIVLRRKNQQFQASVSSRCSFFISIFHFSVLVSLAFARRALHRGLFRGGLGELSSSQDGIQETELRSFLIQLLVGRHVV